jgi:hypothetical protein
MCSEEVISKEAQLEHLSPKSHSPAFEDRCDRHLIRVQCLRNLFLRAAVNTTKAAGGGGVGKFGGEGGRRQSVEK